MSVPGDILTGLSSPALHFIVSTPPPQTSKPTRTINTQPPWSDETMEPPMSTADEANCETPSRSNQSPLPSPRPTTSCPFLPSIVAGIVTREMNPAMKLLPTPAPPNVLHTQIAGIRILPATRKEKLPLTHPHPRPCLRRIGRATDMTLFLSFLFPFLQWSPCFFGRISQSFNS